MSAPPPLPFIPPPPPGACVPTRPPGAVTPKFQKKRKGGLQLDMTDMFPGNKNAKKAIPPWERRKKAPPGGANAKGKSKVPARQKTPPPKVRAKKGIPAPSQHKTPVVKPTGSAPVSEGKPSPATPSPPVSTASPVTASPPLPASVAAVTGSPDIKTIQVPTTSGSEVKPPSAPAAPAVERTLLPLTATSSSTTVTASPPPPPAATVTTDTPLPSAAPIPAPAPTTTAPPAATTATTTTSAANNTNVLAASTQSYADFGETQRFSAPLPTLSPTGVNQNSPYPYSVQPSGQASSEVLSLAGSAYHSLPQVASGMSVSQPNPYPASAVAPPAAATAPAGPVLTDVLAPAAATEPVIEPRILYNQQIQEIVTKPFPASYTQLLKQERKELLEKIKTDKVARKAFEAAEAEKRRQRQPSEIDKENRDGVLWRNVYDFQPSPSAALHHHHPPLALYAATSSTSRHPTTAPQQAPSASPHQRQQQPKGKRGGEGEAKHKYRRQLLPQDEAWRGVYWQHVDVHRYVARRYFGMPPPAEE